MTDTKQQKCNEYISYLKLNYKLKKTLRGQNMDGDGGRQAPWFSTSLVHVDWLIDRSHEWIRVRIQQMDETWLDSNLEN